MAQRTASRPASLEERAERAGEIIATLGLAAMAFVSQARVDEMLRHWLADARDELDAEALGEAMALALDVALFAPSAGGSTAIDRLARQHRPANAEERAVLAALQRASFRVLRIEATSAEEVSLVDLATGERLRLVDPGFPAGCEGLALAVRVAVIEGDAVVAAGPVTPLDEAALEVARGRMRADGKGLTNPNRCAEAVYRQVVRFGTLPVPGLNRPPEGEDFPFSPEDGPLHALAFAWADAGAEPSPADIQAVRQLLSATTLLEAASGCVAAREMNAGELALAYERILTIQVETAERRAATGLHGGFVSLDAVAGEIGQAVRAGMAPAEVGALFEEVRRRVRLSGSAATPHGAELDKVLGRIQALRAKTVDRGCTEEEAMAAAGKVAELLDRHGLSLSEVELKEQACEGVGVGTGRRRSAPIDNCIPAIGMFCDCRVWGEKASDGEIRYVFFGLPADVAGARYLYELVSQAFATESELFKRSGLYREHPSGNRRSATQSFQTGLADGIARKLHALHRQRGDAIRTETGRDLVPVKEAVIEDELARLGLRFHARGGRRGRYVLEDAYAAGHEAGERFEYRAGIPGEPAPGPEG